MADKKKKFKSHLYRDPSLEKRLSELPDAEEEKEINFDSSVQRGLKKREFETDPKVPKEKEETVTDRMSEYSRSLDGSKEDSKTIKEWEELADSMSGPVYPKSNLPAKDTGKSWKERKENRDRALMLEGMRQAKENKKEEADPNEKSDPEFSKDEMDFMKGKQAPITPEFSQEEVDFMKGKQEPIEPESKEESKTEKESAPPAPKEGFVGDVVPFKKENTPPPTPEQDPLEKKLEDAVARYEASKKNIDKREAIETFFNGLAMVGAGMAGRATGTDMSKVKFKTQDWERKRDRAGKEFEGDRADIRQQGRERTQKEQFKRTAEQRDAALGEQRRSAKVREGLSREQLEEAIRHNKAMEQLGWGKNKAALLKAAATASAKSGSDILKKSEKIREDMERIRKSDADDDTKRRELTALFMEQAGMRQDEANKLVTDEGIIWDSTKDMDEIYEQYLPILETKLFTSQLQSRTPEGRIPVINQKTGQVAHYPKDVDLPPGWEPMDE